MNKLVIDTQYLENYGSSENPYMKFKGGSTYVEDYCVKSQTGKIILFDSSKKHKVTELKEGSRFVLLAWYSNG